MKKQTCKNYFKIGILLFGIALLFTNCETESVLAIDMSQTNDVQDAKSWFENNPKKNNYSLLNFTETVDWTSAKVSYQDNKVAVEVPLILKHNFNLVAAKSNSSLQSVNRFVFIKNNQSDFSSFIINITDSDNNIQLVNDLNKINYFNISEDFSGKILIISNNGTSTTINLIANGKEKIKPDNIYSKAPSVSCYEIVELFDVGPPRHTGIIYCVDDSGYNPYNDQPNYPSHGGGGTPTPIDDQIINNLNGKANCTYLKLKNNSILVETIKKFKGKTPVNLIINQESNLAIKDQNGNNVLVNAITNYSTSYNISITLNTERSNYRPSLAVARTILHEAIHAEIYRKIKTTSGLTYSNGAWKLPDGSRANFPSLFDAYNEDPSNPDHNYMANYYRKSLEYGMKEYATSIGEMHSDQFYKDMAWSGLLDTKAWEKQYADPVYANNEKNRIKNVIINYEKSNNNECQ